MRPASAELAAAPTAAQPVLVGQRLIPPAEAVRLLMEAFYADPLIAALFGGAGRPAQRRCFFEFLLAKSRLLGEQLVGLQREGRLVAAASLEPPAVKRPDIARLCAFGYHCLRLMLGMRPRRFVMLNTYMRATLAARPRRPHHYLVFIGVDPAAQGQGHGRALLEHIHSLVDGHALSTGVGLDTENPRNLPLYERFGYQLIDRKSLGDVPIYCMFRPRGGDQT